jgi:predicted PurR-regulated permease PerM
MSGRALQVVAAIGVVLLLYWGAPFFVPLFLALMISTALAPVVSGLTVLVRWRALAAGIVVTALVALLGAAVWAWSDDVQKIWQELPQAAKTVSRSLQDLVRRPAGPINEVKKAAAELESVATTGTRTSQPSASAPAPASKSMWDIVWQGGKGVASAAAQTTAVLFLVFFMLASGDLFKRKLLKIAAERNKTRFTSQVLEQIDDQVRRYLGVLAIANVLVGLGTWLAFWALGVKYAGLWGVLAGVLHTAPYFGPGIIAAGSFVAALVQFDSWEQALLVSASTIAIATVVGFLWATWFASKRARMNTTAAFIGLLFFGWIWGFWGLLLAIPLLAIMMTICEHNERWKPVAQLLSR